jgi:Rrf2 family nitric oxide-sensitive transcriptional repressor
MRFTKSLDNALLLLIFVAQRPERRVKIAEVARFHSLSASHLMNTAHRLASSGYLITARGRGGGVMLARAPETISIGAVVRDLEPAPTESNLERAIVGNAHPRELDGLAAVMRSGYDALLSELDRHTLAEISGSDSRRLALWRSAHESSRDREVLRRGNTRLGRNS